MKDNALFRRHRSLCGQSILSAVTLVIAILLVAPFAGAQSTGGRIRGTVTDPSGGAVAGAKVTAINEATNVARDTQTGPNGDYIFLEVPVGAYTVEVTSQGFKKYSRKGIVLNLNEVISVDLTLQIGGSTEVAEVTGAARHRFVLISSGTCRYPSIRGSRASCLMDGKYPASRVCRAAFRSALRRKRT